MAKLLPNGVLVGVTGPMYFRRLNGVQIVQTRPVRSRQDKSKNTAAILFKNTAFSLKVIRNNIECFLGKRQDSKAHLRLMGVAMNALRENTDLPLAETTVYNTSLDKLVGFEWNTACLFSSSFLGEITVNTLENDVLLVDLASFIPKEQVVFPPECTQASLRIKSFSMEDTNVFVSTEEHGFTLDFRKEDTQVNAVCYESVVLPEAHLVLVVAEIQFYYSINNNPDQLSLYNSKAFNPSIILYVDHHIRK